VIGCSFWSGVASRQMGHGSRSLSSVGCFLRWSLNNLPWCGRSIRCSAV